MVTLHINWRLHVSSTCLSVPPRPTRNRHTSTTRIRKNNRPERRLSFNHSWVRASKSVQRFPGKDGVTTRKEGLLLRSENGGKDERCRRTLKDRQRKDVRTTSLKVRSLPRESQTCRVHVLYTTGPTQRQTTKWDVSLLLPPNYTVRTVRTKSW